MARQTTCRPMDGVWTDVGWAGPFGVIGIVLAVIGAVTTLIVLLTTSLATVNPVTIAVAAGFVLAGVATAIAALVHIRNYFFDGKLACIEEEECAIGRVWIIEDNEDGDRSMNLVLAPARDTDTEVQYRAMSQPARLVYSDPGVSDRDPSWSHNPFAVRLGVPPTSWGPNELPYFHCEIEGTFLDEWITAVIAWMTAIAGWAALLLGLALAGSASGLIGWIVVAAVAILLLLLALFGLLPSQDDVPAGEAGPIGEATPGEAGPIVTDSGGNMISVGDFVVLAGRHVVDTGHAREGGCWNEFHPVRAIAKLTSEEYDRVDDVSGAGADLVSSYCKALADFHAEVGAVSRKLTCLEHPRVG